MVRRSPNARTARPFSIRVVAALLMLYAVVTLSRFMRHGAPIGRAALLVSGLAFVFGIAIWHGLRWGWMGAVTLLFMMLTWMAAALLLAVEGRTVIVDLSMMPFVVARGAMELCLLILLLMPFVRRRLRAAAGIAIVLLGAGSPGLAGAQESAKAAPPIDVLIVGTYHFDNPGQDLVNPKVSDVLAPAKQQEIAEVVEGLARFRPTKIAIEAQPGSAGRQDSLYRAVLARTRAFSRNEIEQLGFRLAQRLKHERVYPIDAPGRFPIEPVFAYAERHDTAGLRRVRGVLAQVAAEHDSLQRQATVRQILRFENDSARLSWSHGLYLDLARIGGADSLQGATLLAAWYERNVRIFVNLLRIAKPGDRILVLFGAGHVPTLRELVKTAPGFRLLEAREYL